MGKTKAEQLMELGLKLQDRTGIPAMYILAAASVVDRERRDDENISGMLDALRGVAGERRER